VVRHTSWNLASIDDLRPVLESCNDAADPGSALRFAICAEPGGGPIGTIGFRGVSVAHRTAEFGYDLHPAHWGRGIATACCRAVVAWGFVERRFVRVQACALDSNATSMRVLEKCGFVREGLLRRYRMVRGEPRDFRIYAAFPMNDDPNYPEGFRRVTQALAERGHPHAPRWLDDSARTSQQAADALGIALGQIAKSVIFRRRSDDAAVLVVTSGDRRVDEKKVEALVGALARADADFVKTATGFSIGGVAPLAHSKPPLTLIDRELFRFDEIWAAAGHPNGVFRSSPQQLEALTGAPVADVVQQ
jgi:prolyl-tRNA editing enzyme YbaK/EbsC (Cys-tRNA(Pro) deacylase)/GNAT superfamily N-acetyltransferase